jgi:hypothetical protein
VRHQGKGVLQAGKRGGGYMSYEEEDTCHMRRRIHVIRGGGYMSYEGRVYNRQAKKET